METVLSYPRQYATALGNHFRQPLMETVLSYPRQYATALGNHFRQPLMETVLSYPKSLEPQHRQLRV
jgi:hypothetical protein